MVSTHCSLTDRAQAPPLLVLQPFPALTPAPFTLPFRSPAPQVKQLSIRAWDEGRIRISAHPTQEQREVWRMRPLDRLVTLPGRVLAATAQASLGLNGQLFIRIEEQPAAPPSPLMAE